MEKEKELTPMQIECRRLYNDPESSTFGNARGSAIKAGFSKSYANNLTIVMPKWFASAKKRRKRMLNKAEAKLERLLDSKDEKVVADISKFIAKTLGKKVGYSERMEHTGADGKDLIPDQAAKDKAAAAINEYLNDSPGITPG